MLARQPRAWGQTSVADTPVGTNLTALGSLFRLRRRRQRCPLLQHQREPPPYLAPQGCRSPAHPSQAALHPCQTVRAQRETAPGVEGSRVSRGPWGQPQATVTWCPSTHAKEAVCLPHSPTVPRIVHKAHVALSGAVEFPNPNGTEALLEGFPHVCS